MPSRPAYAPSFRFFSKVRVDEKSGCWQWTAGHTFAFDGRTTNPRRAAWLLYRGPVPDAARVARTCKTSGCLNPKHLRLEKRKTQVPYEEESASKPKEQRKAKPVGKKKVRALPQSDAGLSPAECFKAQVRTDDATGCWQWTGRGQTFPVEGRAVQLNRASWQLLRGPLPDAARVARSCQTDNCLNPEHLHLEKRKSCAPYAEEDAPASPVVAPSQPRRWLVQPPGYRFKLRVREDAATGCWLWTGGSKFMLKGQALTPQAAAWALYRRPAVPVGSSAAARCSTHGCVNPKHLEVRVIPTPTPKPLRPVKKRLPLAERFWGHVDKSEAAGCWPWRGYRVRGGRGVVIVDGKARAAHVLAYELAVGPVPAGQRLSHSCSDRACCNPAHLEARSVVRAAAKVRKPTRPDREECWRGHEYTPSNSYFPPKAKSRGPICKRCLLIVLQTLRLKLQTLQIQLVAERLAGAAAQAPEPGKHEGRRRG